MPGGADVWSFSNTTVSGGYFTIQRWTGSTWTSVSGAAVRIAVDPVGKPWVVNSQNIYGWSGSSWIAVPGAATDVGIGANGDVWAIGVAAVSGGLVSAA
jgi:hypothetical protein